MATRNPLSAFTASMIAGCEAAINAGVFYQDAFNDFVLARMGGFDCQAVLVETIDLNPVAAGGALRERTAWEAYKALPRGHLLMTHLAVL